MHTDPTRTKATILLAPKPPPDSPDTVHELRLTTATRQVLASHVPGPPRRPARRSVSGEAVVECSSMARHVGQLVRLLARPRPCLIPDGELLHGNARAERALLQAACLLHCSSSAPDHLLPHHPAALVPGLTSVAVNPFLDKLHPSGPSRVLQALPHQHQLHAKPVLAIAFMVVGPDLIPARHGIVLQEEGRTGVMEGPRHDRSRSKLCAEHGLHGLPVTSEAPVGPVLRATQGLLQAKGLVARQGAELLRVVPELEGLERRLCIPKPEQLARLTGGRQHEACIAKVPEVAKPT
mmetsp:Transcript_56101/g.126453  ORF Transcript_56101/g.126453 Transcript_56101/m.126453 type:complete len:294 (-) Transcript_56101:443-1324(-)